MKLQSLHEEKAGLGTGLLGPFHLLCHRLPKPVRDPSVTWEWRSFLISVKYFALHTESFVYTKSGWTRRPGDTKEQ